VTDAALGDRLAAWRAARESAVMTEELKATDDGAAGATA
jgi:hypothetical protein